MIRRQTTITVDWLVCCTSAELARDRLSAIVKADREAVPAWRWVRVPYELRVAFFNLYNWGVKPAPPRPKNLHKDLYVWRRRQ